MNPFYFGSSQDPLFGVYHAPHSDTGRSVGVLLCYPMGQEYMRAHRAFRQLALLLSRSGFHVMRFDYYGTGDSAGPGDHATIERWIDDIGTAIDELKETADVAEVAVVGLRLGGTLASHAVASRTDVTQFVLWDPVTNGTEFLKELLGDDGEARLQNPAHTGETIGVMGFPLSSALRKSLSTLELAAAPEHSAIEVFLVVSGETAQQGRVEAAMSRRTTRFASVCVPSPGNWNEVDDFGSALIPQGIIRAVVNHLVERVPE